jgi:hypothetical protein
MVKGRCMRCKEQKEIQNPVIGQTSRGGYIAKGTCKCGCKMCAIMSKDNAEKAIADDEAKKGF